MVMILDVILLTVILTTGLGGALFLFNYWKLGARDLKDISDQQKAPFEWVQPAVQALTALGFRRLGETQVRLPFSRKPGTAWLLVDAAGTTLAEVVGRRPRALVTLFTGFGDRAVLETGWPVGQDMVSSNFYAQTVESTVAAAYQQHQARMTEWGSGQGTPRGFETMGEALDWVRLYWSRFAGQRLRGSFWLNLARVLALVYAVALIAILGAAQPWTYLQPEALNAQLVSLAIWLLPAVLAPMMVGQALEARRVKRRLANRRPA